jgi:hypothetical protein
MPKREVRKWRIQMLLLKKLNQFPGEQFLTYSPEVFTLVYRGILEKLHYLMEKLAFPWKRIEPCSGLRSHRG